MPATIFSGTKVKTLKDILSLNSGADVISSTTDPTSSAVSANPGSILLNTSNGKVYRKLDSGSSTNWEEVGAGVGGINYVSNDDFEANITGYSTYADGSATPVDGTGGSPSLTFARTTSSPLRGTGSGLLTPGGLGNGVSYDFTIHNADKAAVLEISFDFEIGTYSSYTDGDITIWIYDVTNGSLIQPISYKVLKATGQEQWKAVFQTSAASTSYRILWHQATAATGYTLKIDNVKVGPQDLVYGAPVGDWRSDKTFTYDAIGTVSNNNVWYRRVGDSMQVRGTVVCGTTTATPFKINLPTGYSIDSAKFNATTNIQRVGFLNHITNGGLFIDQNYVLFYDGSTTTGLFFSNQGNASSNWTKYNGDDVFTSGRQLCFEFTIPIQGWGDSLLMSNEADTRVVAAKYSSSATTTITSGATTVLDFATKEFDTHSAASGTWRYYAPVAGKYRVSSTASFASSAWSAGQRILLILQKNGSISGYLDRKDIHASSTIVMTVGGTRTIELTAGDYIEVAINHNRGAGTDLFGDITYVEVERIAGPASIAASETVAARYTTAAGQSLTNATETTIDFGTKDYDTHGSVTTGGSWQFTCPVAGKYRVTGKLTLSSASAFAASEQWALHLHKNGSSVSNYVRAYAGGPGGSEDSIFYSDVISCAAGDTLRFRTTQYSGSSVSLIANALYNSISIEKIGI